jgi:hypothetical protein
MSNYIDAPNGKHDGGAASSNSILNRNDGISVLLDMGTFNRKGRKRLSRLSDLQIATLLVFKPDDALIWPYFVFEIQKLLSKIELKAKAEGTINQGRPIVSKNISQAICILSCIKHMRDAGFDCLMTNRLRSFLTLEAGPELFELLAEIAQAGPARESRRTISIYSAIQFIELYVDELLEPPRLKTKKTFSDFEQHEIECGNFNWLDDDGESYLEAIRDMPFETFFDELPVLQPVLDWFLATRPTFDRNQLKRGWQYLVKRSEDWHEQREPHNFYSAMVCENTSWDCHLSEYLASHHTSFPQNSPYKIVPLTTPQSLLDESEAMHHCVSSYIEYCVAGSTRIFSVRLAASNKRFATAELNMAAGEWKLIQLKGMANREFIHRMNSTSAPLAIALTELVAWYNQYGDGRGQLNVCSEPMSQVR